MAVLLAVPLVGPWTDAETKALLEFLLFHRGQSKSSLMSNPAEAVQHMRLSGSQTLPNINAFAWEPDYINYAHAVAYN